MADYGSKSIGGVQLPTDPTLMGRATHGFVTPSQDLMPQRISVPPKRVVPIIFLPGIMGSNLRLKRQRQTELGRENNIAWRPDFYTFALEMLGADPILRQQLLDPLMTEVDSYDSDTPSTGDPKESADQRNSKVSIAFEYGRSTGIETPLLMNDPPGHPKPRTRDQKARERGWGEVFFSSYSDLLELCEQRLNTGFRNGQLDEWWQQLLGVPPSEWQATARPALSPITEDTLRKVLIGCWYPVHAMGYNWLESNETSGTKTAHRIGELVNRYRKTGYECEKVILVTHSMGGLVARAIVHPLMGKLQNQVLGVVHGVMPAIGAAATYKRMRCGFEGQTAGRVLGNTGPKVTAVLANAQGGLELLPTTAYGNSWLKVHYKKNVILELPQRGDPYEEIYKLQGRWYGLLIDDWINPAERENSNFELTCVLLDNAKRFHAKLAGYYHPQTWAHYGADAKRVAWKDVSWAIHSAHFSDVTSASILADNHQGSLRLLDIAAPMVMGGGREHSLARLAPPSDPGDETVPSFSADDQCRSGKLKGLFRQTGYEHQGSYKDSAALFSTVYSIIRIAETLSWPKK